MIAVVAPVYGNAPTLAPLRDRLAAALAGEEWTLRLVIDACPDGSGAAADALARSDGRVHVTHLADNGGQHAALVAGLRAEPVAEAWVLLDADLQDPPEAVPVLLDALRRGPAAGVFAGRRGAYESGGRRLSGMLHRHALRALTGLPADAGAFLALDPGLRVGILHAWADGAPSIVAAAGVSRLPLTSVPVRRAPRPVGRSAWSSSARLRQSHRTLAWVLRRAVGRPLTFRPALPRTQPTRS